MHDKFKVQAVADDGSKSAVIAKELVVGFGDDKELRIFLSNYDGKGELTLLSDDTSIVIRPAGCNMLRLALECPFDFFCGPDS